MDATTDIAEFLTSRRARVTPEHVGLTVFGARRVKGLRREEVASLAGVSVEYYKRLERGNASGVSDTVLYARAIAQQPRRLGARGKTGTRRVRHPVVRELELSYEVMNVAANDGLTISVYSAEPGSRSEQGPDLLASWTTTPDAQSPTTSTTPTYADHPQQH